MHEFRYMNGELFCERVRVVDAARRFGTPLYLYSQGTIVDHYRKLERAFTEVPHLICYSLKANSSLAISRIMARLGAGADVVSGGELFRALKAGIPASKIVYAGVGKTEREIEYALKARILMFNVESESELVAIDRIARRMRRSAPFAIRINPDVEARTHRYITTGKKEAKFGLNKAAAEELIRKSRKLANVRLTGLHMHIGSQITEPGPFIEGLRRVTFFARSLEEKGTKLEWLNMGGGLGIIYSEERATSANGFAKALLPLVKATPYKLILEPGRFIVGNAGILVTKVLYIKKSERKHFVIVDAGMNDLIRPALYGSHHEILPLEGVDDSWLLAGGASRGEARSERATILADVVGPVCESGDFFATSRRIPAVKEGDYLAVFSAGAYGFSMASNYNSRPRPAEALVRVGKLRLVRERETYQDLIRGERYRSIL